MTGRRYATRGTRTVRPAAALAVVVIVAVAVAVLAAATAVSLQPLPASLDAVADGAGRDDSAPAASPPAVQSGSEARAPAALGGADPPFAAAQVLDRRGTPLNVTFTTEWNVYERVAVHEVPSFLREAFITAEDRRFYRHGGVDWLARLDAAATNLVHGRAVRGASTITEQAVRMLHPRPRTLWSRWLEGWEAARLERAFGKDEILEFYLNQVPYASNRRGVRQAARHYFDRDLGTLSRKEMLALAVLVRAPSRLDPKRAPNAADGAVARLADALVERGSLTADEKASLLDRPLALAEPSLAVRAPHFVGQVRAQSKRHAPGATKIVTTLDAAVQAKVQALLDARLSALAALGVRDGAALVVDHVTGEILAWAIGGGAAPGGPATHIDAVVAPRQPGSAMKPFLYALALDTGWTAAQIIVDAPLTESASGGLHTYRNYSRRFHGPVTLRDALGNSLNIPAVKTLQFVGAERYLHTLRALGFERLNAHPDHYGDGIALGTGEVSLLELVQAYSALANGGVFKPSTALLHDSAPRPARRVFSAEAATLIGHILSDPDARALEFGRDSVLRFPVQTAVKTGTSSDFRDAWAVGFDDRHTIGVWLGNLDRTPSIGVSGSIGPALLLRSLFSELNRGRTTRPLPLSAGLEQHETCVPLPGVERSTTAAAQPGAAESASSPAHCSPRREWFLPGTAPGTGDGAHGSASSADAYQVVAKHDSDTRPHARLAIRQPTNGLRLAYDPRLPARSQAFQFVIDGALADDEVLWNVDGREQRSKGATWLWPVTPGEHRVAAIISRDGARIGTLGEVVFVVK